MKKLVIANSNEEVSFGDTIRKVREMNTSFGTIKSIISITLTPGNIKTLLNTGVIKYIDDTDEEKDDLSYYVESLAKSFKVDLEQMLDILENMNKVCPRAVLELLLTCIAVHMYNDNPSKFDSASNYYSLKLKDGTVGRVTNLNKYIPLFKSEADAEHARMILKKQLEFMYGKQKDN